MIAKSTKQKNRQQRREAAAILAALMAAVPAEAGQEENDGWPTCRALNQTAGVRALPAEAAWLARFGRGSDARAYEASLASSDVVAALGHNTPARVLELAGLL
jgi:hypothetical protein